MHDVCVVCGAYSPFAVIVRLTLAACGGRAPVHDNAAVNKVEIKSVDAKSGHLSAVVAEMNLEEKNLAGGGDDDDLLDLLDAAGE